MTGSTLVTDSRCAETALLLERCRAVRRFTHELCRPLKTEDFVLQSMEQASPTRWHLAHTNWFFETFVLAAALPNYRPFHPDFCYLFNSYYNGIGDQFPRSSRGLLSRPTVAEVFEYRAHVDAALEDFLASVDPDHCGDLLRVVEVGLQHEQQHQELILTDLKHAFSLNPLHPVYRSLPPAEDTAPSLRWHGYPEALRWIGADPFKNGLDTFAYDNEAPRHRVFAESFEMASRLCTNEEFFDFIEDDGYRRPELWLDAGWQQVRDHGWEAPLYWTRRDGGWWNFTLSGLRPVNPAEPVCHISYFEADAFARWSGARLPTEAEWETVAGSRSLRGNFAEDGILHPQTVVTAGGHGADEVPHQLFGDVWEWTSSPYGPYPGYRAPEGALGEYNGKFMCNQYVLRGGSCATSHTHIRATYRNFFPPEARWQFAGLRLAR